MVYSTEKLRQWAIAAVAVLVATFISVYGIMYGGSHQRILAAPGAGTIATSTSQVNSLAVTGSTWGDPGFIWVSSGDASSTINGTSYNQNGLTYTTFNIPLNGASTTPFAVKPSATSTLLSVVWKESSSIGGILTTHTIAVATSSSQYINVGTDGNSLGTDQNGLLLATSTLSTAIIPTMAVYASSSVYVTNLNYSDGIGGAFTTGASSTYVSSALGLRTFTLPSLTTTGVGQDLSAINRATTTSSFYRQPTIGANTWVIGLFGVTPGWVATTGISSIPCSSTAVATSCSGTTTNSGSVEITFVR